MALDRLASIGLVAALALVLSGCFSEKGSDPPAETEAPCVFPSPCGGEWPDGLKGPFELQSGDPELVTLESHDGTILRGWLWRPVLPEGVGAPVVLISSPYHGGNQEAPGDGSGGAGSHARYI